MTETPQQTLPVASPLLRPRLDGLDGIRGLAAAMVVITHTPVFVQSPGWFAGLGLGNPWVAIFITLSGFCLYLPGAQRENVELPRPFREFMARRARRIVPAWYASLALCLLAAWVLNRAGDKTAVYYLPKDVWDLPVHLTLFHSLTRYSGSINGPGYTLGTEWQLYIAMILFLAIARRAGWLCLIGVFTLTSLPLPGALGNLVHKLFSHTFTLPFIFGMLGARLAVGGTVSWIGGGGQQARHSRTVPSLLLALVLVGATILFFVVNPMRHDVGCWLTGIACTSGFVLMARFPDAVPARFLASPPLRFLGSISYSLYLIHFPIMGLLTWAARQAGIVPENASSFALLAPAYLVGTLAFAALFARLFEQPFLNYRPDAAAAAAARTKKGPEVPLSPPALEPSTPDA